MAWLVQHQEIVTWSLAFLAAATALAAGYVQGRFALRAIRVQLSHGDQRLQEQEARDDGAFLKCLAVDLVILEKRLASTRMQVEDAIRDPSSNALSASELKISVPDTIAAPWRELARLPAPLVEPVRTLSLQLYELRELAAEADLSRNQPAFVQAVLLRTQRAASTTEQLKAQVDLSSTAAPDRIGNAAQPQLEKLSAAQAVEKES